MQSRSYPDKDYTCDGIAQSALSEYATLRDRAFHRCGAVVLILVAAFFLSSYLGLKTLAWVIMGTIAALVILVIIFVTHTPRLRCTHCSSRMKRRYKNRSGGSGDDLFLVCNNCKTYADAHLSRE